MKKIQIPESELRFDFSRSGGAGGQNVNKVETKVMVRWNFKSSPLLTEEQKNLISRKLKSRINRAGELLVSSQAERSQNQNKQKAIEILNELAGRALTVLPKRKKTKVPKKEKKKRLEQKRRQSEKKQSRKNFLD